MEVFKDYGLRENVPFRDISTFKIGGSVRYLVYPKNEDEVSKCIEIAEERNLNYIIMGNGSNILCRDGGFKGVIISTLGLNSLERNENTLISGSGVSIYDLSYFAMMNGLSGMEFAEGIPGSVGGAVFMNAGAYDSSIEDIIVSSLVLEKGEVKKYNKDEMKLGKRYSIFKDTGGIILSSEFLLKNDNIDLIKNTMEGYHSKRILKQPLEFASAGSIFKRPEGHYAGKLIEESGLKGLRIGDAQVSLKHAGFIINRGNATAKEVLTLIETIQKVVRDNTGVALEREVVVIGED